MSAHRPIVTGWIRVPADSPMLEQPSHVTLEADGRRLTVTASDQLVLKCGKASITLTAAGKVLIQGSYVSQRSSGLMKINGGSIQLN